MILIRQKVIQRNTRGLFSLISLLIFAWLSGCSFERENGFHKPPLEMPFELQKLGSNIEIEMHITEYKEYVFALDFMYKENDQADRDRVKKLVGDSSHDGDFGILTPLHLKISAIDALEGKTILDHEFKKLKLVSWGADNFEKHITGIKLKPGNYLIMIESLSNIPELVGTQVTFRVAYSTRL